MAYRYKTSVLVFFTVGHRLVSSSTIRSKEHLKNIIKPEIIPTEYWKGILTVAEDLKQKIKKNGKRNLKLLDDKHVTLLFVKPHGRFQLAYTLGCDLLGANKTLYCDADFENQPNPGNGAKVLSNLTDMLVTHGLHHDVLIKIVSSCRIPVFPASSNLHCLQKALSDMMTFRETFDRLKGLTLAWIGPPNTLFNSYMVLCSKLGVKFQYHLVCSFGGGKMSPVRPFKVVLKDEEMILIGFKSAPECINGAHVVATSMHPDESSKITLELLKNADPNWLFVHSLPRSWKEVSDDVFYNERNLSWKTSENYLYVAMAVILTNLGNVPQSQVSECE